VEASVQGVSTGRERRALVIKATWSGSYDTPEGREFTAAGPWKESGMVEIDVISASADDQDAVLGILRSAGARSGHRAGMWGSEFPDVIRDLPAGLVYLARLEGRPVATFVLRWSDELVWGPDDGQAGYLHRLATHPDVAGRRIGAQLITAAADLTRERGRRWLRLDCDRDNQRLRAYYEALGFTHAGDVTGLPRSTRPGYRSASRYQRAVSA
jgi:ribosomal protein S18 acetylase RimI-like enzyme